VKRELLCESSRCLFLLKSFIESYNNHDNRLVNYVISVIVYNLLPPLDQFINAISPEIAGPGLEEVVKPVFKVLVVIEGYALHLVRQRAEKMVIRRSNIRRIRWMLKKLSIELLKCRFDDVCNMRPGVVVEHRRLE